MTYNSKRTITSMVVGIILFAAYAIHALRKYALPPANMASWAKTMLVFIGIGAVGLFIVQILFHIVYAIGIAVKEQEQSDKEVERLISASIVEDERDKLVSLKATRIGYIVIGAGFIATLAALALGGTAILALHILLGAFLVGSLVEGAVSVYLHERGVHNV